MKPLKDIYTNKSIFQKLTADMKKVYPSLKEDAFFDALTDDLENLELMERVNRLVEVCHTFLPQDYLKSLDILYKFADKKENVFIYLFLPAFVAEYGQEHYEKSIKAIHDFTQYSSSEMGVRTFLEQDLERTLEFMFQWTQSDNTHVRRLASEGCRPRLPWAKKIPALINDPELTWDILEALKEDSEKYVQKSVANHINDISKDHPDWIIQKIKKWNLKHPVTQWIVTHGTRTLIKQGHKGALALRGNHHKPEVQLDNIRWDKKVKLGEGCSLELDLVSKSNKAQPLVIDYQIHFCKSNGELKSKTFKLKKYTLRPKEVLSLKMKYAFKDMTTRKHYAGKHMWQLMINGELSRGWVFQVQS